MWSERIVVVMVGYVFVILMIAVAVVVRMVVSLQHCDDEGLDAALLRKIVRTEIL